MVKNNPYDPDVYRRLELVRKQFKHQAAEEKKQQWAERKWEILNRIKQNKFFTARNVVYIIMAAMVFSVIGVLILK